MKKLDYSSAYEGQTILSLPLLHSKTLLAVYVSGIGMDKILSSGTPTGKKVKFVQFTSYASIYFGVPLNRGNYILILYQ